MSYTPSYGALRGVPYEHHPAISAAIDHDIEAGRLTANPDCPACGGDGSRVVGHDPIEDKRVACGECHGTGYAKLVAMPTRERLELVLLDCQEEQSCYVTIADAVMILFDVVKAER